MFPAKFVVVPSVAELPTCQKTLSPSPPFVKTTDELLAVVSVLPIWKMNTGVYCFTSSAQLTGALTLNALGNANAHGL
jgi:hypothetical protein